MQYAGFLIRRERLKRDWSQEGLCRGICTVSYLSKIEQGKADPSPEITKLLLGRMDIPWHDSDELTAMKDAAWDALISGDDRLFREIVAREDWPLLENSPHAPDKMLLECIVNNIAPPGLDGLELCLDKRQLSLLRLFQGREDEALRLYPCAAAYMHAGINQYSRARLNAYQGALTEAATAVLTLAVGALGEILDLRLCLTLCGMFTMAVCFMTVWKNRAHVRVIYETQKSG